MQWNQFSNKAKLAESIPSFKRLIRNWLGLDKMYIFHNSWLLSLLLLSILLLPLFVIIIIIIIITTIYYIYDISSER